MILLRGIRGEEYARRIEHRIVDCRDILSALLAPPVTGYEYSDYYEKNLVKALLFFGNGKFNNINDPTFLCSIMIDYYIPYIYLTYFHILNDKSLEWLDKFEDDYSFIAVNVKLDSITHTAIGKEYFGARMRYVENINDLKQGSLNDFRVACMCSIEDLFADKQDMVIPLQIYNSIFFPLLCREVDEKFTDIENEFRIIAYECPKFFNHKIEQQSRMANVRGHSGTEYSGILEPGQNTLFESDLRVLNNYRLHINDLLIQEDGKITIDSVFKSIDISYISDDYCFIGNKKDCANYIDKMLKKPTKDIYVDKTVKKAYRRGEMHNCLFFASHQNVDYD